jgi:pimeloyl-ACP methyl ester carboxylesterase
MAWRSVAEGRLADFQRVSRGGARIDVSRHDSTTVVVFFDGGAGDCPAALQETHRVVSWSGRADGLQGWLDGEGLNQAHLIGHAAGGYDALRFAISATERIQSLILSETGAGQRRGHAALRGVTVPVLIVAGGHGSACPLPAARRLASHFGNGRVAEIVEAVRSPYAETQEEWCEVVLQFLRSVTRPKAAAP